MRRIVRSRQQAFSDILPWSHLADDGLVITKGGQLLAGYYFTPPDSASSTDEEVAAICHRVNEALARLGDGWASWTDVISYPSDRYPPAEASNFPDPVSRMVDEERRRQFEAEGAHFENDRAFLLAYTPPRRQVSKLQSLMYDDPRKGDVTPFARIQEGFKKALEVSEDQVARQLSMRRMQSFAVTDAFGQQHLQDELVNYLNYCATGRPHPVMLPASGAYLDSLIGAQEAWVGETPIIGREFVGVVGIEGFPAEAQPNVIAALNTLSMPYRFTQRFIYMDTPTATKELDKYRKNWRQKARGLMSVIFQTVGGPVNEHAVKMYKDAEDAASWAESGTVKFGWYSAAIVVRHRDYFALQEMLRAVERAINDCGFGARIEGTNTIEAFLGAIPGDIDANVRRPPMHTLALSCLLPLSGIWTGRTEAPCPQYPQPSPPLMHAGTVGHIPFRFNLHVGDVGHTLIFGPTGMGKTVFANMTAIQARRYPGIRIWSFDYKRGMMPVVLACGGRHYDIAGDDSPSFCPLAEIDNPTDREWAENYLEILYQLQTGNAPEQPVRTQIHLAVERIAAPGNAHRSMTDFCMALQDRSAAEVFQYYTLQGNGGRLMDGRSDSIRDTDFNVFETQHLLEAGEKLAMPVLLHLFRRFERSLNGQPALLYIAEAWQAFSHPLWVERIQKWLRVLRSKNCSVIMDTQSLADAVNTKLLALLVESCPTHVFLPNPSARKTGTPTNPGPYDLYRTFGINDQQVSIIESAEPKRHYYVESPEGCRLIDLNLGPLAAAVCTMTSETEVDVIRDMARTYGRDWFPRYLETKGLDHLIAEFGETWPIRIRELVA